MFVHDHALTDHYAALADIKLFKIALILHEIGVIGLTELQLVSGGGQREAKG